MLQLKGNVEGLGIESDGAISSGRDARHASTSSSNSRIERSSSVSGFLRAEAEYSRRNAFDLIMLSLRSHGNSGSFPYSV